MKKHDLSAHIRTTYVERGFGNMRDHIKWHRGTYADMWRDAAALSLVEREVTEEKALRREFDQADLHEEEEFAIRQQEPFLDFGIDPPIMSKSVTVNDERERVPSYKATFDEHEQHHLHFETRNLRCASYRRKARESIRNARKGLADKAGLTVDELRLPFGDILEKAKQKV